jgi:hypothetical protein
MIFGRCQYLRTREYSDNEVLPQLHAGQLTRLFSTGKPTRNWAMKCLMNRSGDALPLAREGVLTMKLLRTLCLVLLVPGLTWAQASAPNAGSSKNDSDVATELKALREALSQTQNQMASQQQEIEARLCQHPSWVAANDQRGPDYTRPPTREQL